MHITYIYLLKHIIYISINTDAFLLYTTHYITKNTSLCIFKIHLCKMIYIFIYSFAEV